MDKSKHKFLNWELKNAPFKSFLQYLLYNISINPVVIQNIYVYKLKSLFVLLYKILKNKINVNLQIIKNLFYDIINFSF